MTSNVSLLAARFKGLLADAMKYRDMLAGLTSGPDGEPECEWAAYERSVMHEEINRIRTQSGRSPISLDVMWKRAESQAVGHSDYADKFALYCAELALDVPRAQY